MARPKGGRASKPSKSGRKYGQRADRPPAHPNPNRTEGEKPPDVPPEDAARIAARRLQVFRMRVAGASIPAIAEELKVSRSTVWEDEQAELQALRDETKDLVADFRLVQMERCERLTLALWPWATGVGTDPSRPGHRVAPDLHAVDRIYRLMDRQARLLGLDKAKDTADPKGDTYNFNQFLIAADERFRGEQARQLEAGPTPPDLDMPVISKGE
ncbi:MAG: helix-turn-helix domain-containing protein [Vicinamibacterales bacterium]